MKKYFLFTFVFITIFALRAMESKKEVNSDEIERIRKAAEKKMNEEIAAERRRCEELARRLFVRPMTHDDPFEVQDSRARYCDQIIDVLKILQEKKQAETSCSRK